MTSVFQALAEWRSHLIDLLIEEASERRSSLAAMPLYEQRRLVESLLDGFREFLVTRDTRGLAASLKLIRRMSSTKSEPVAMADVVGLLVRIPDALRTLAKDPDVGRLRSRTPPLTEAALDRADQDALEAVRHLIGSLPSGS